MLAPAASPLLAVAVCSRVLTTYMHTAVHPLRSSVSCVLSGRNVVQMSLRNFCNTLTNFALSGTTQELLLKLNYSYLIIFINGRHKSAMSAMSANATKRVNLTKRTIMQYRATRTLED